jgi:hypothetical protein
MVDILLYLSASSILLIAYSIIFCLVAVIIVSVLRFVGNEYPAAIIAVIVSFILLFGTYKGFVVNAGEIAYASAIFSSTVMIIVFAVPFAMWAFPDAPIFPRCYLIGGLALSLLQILPDSITNFLAFLDISPFAQVKIIQYISVPASLWLLGGFLLNPTRFKQAYSVVIKGHTYSYQEGNYNNRL